MSKCPYCGATGIGMWEMNKKVVSNYLWLSGTYSLSPSPYKVKKTSYKKTVYIRRERG